MVKLVFICGSFSLCFFHAGNLETLEVGPKARGIDTRDELVKFYRANYSSNLMRLVVYGRGIMLPWSFSAPTCIYTARRIYVCFFKTPTGSTRLLRSSACVCRLVTESADELQRLVKEKFCSIRNTGRKAEKFSGQPCLPEHLQVITSGFLSGPPGS